jgi:hypothetical protein
MGLTAKILRILAGNETDFNVLGKKFYRGCRGLSRLNLNNFGTSIILREKKQGGYIPELKHGLWPCAVFAKQTLVYYSRIKT